MRSGGGVRELDPVGCGDGFERNFAEKRISAILGGASSVYNSGEFVFT